MRPARLPVGHALAAGRYRLEAEPGPFAAQALTYRALDTQRDLPVVVLEALPAGARVRRLDGNAPVQAAPAQDAADHQALAEFEHTARALQRLASPFVARVLDVFGENGTCYAVLPWLEGATLAGHLAALAGPMPGTQVQALAVDLLAGLAALHAHGLRHRALQPARIVLAGQTPRPVISGLDRWAAHFDATPDPYRAPEAVQPGKPQGPWSDLYSLCAVLYEALCGQSPPPASERLRITARPGSVDPWVPLSQRFPAQPRALVALVDAGLQLEPRRRPQDVPQALRLLQDGLVPTVPQAPDLDLFDALIAAPVPTPRRAPAAAPRSPSPAAEPPAPAAEGASDVLLACSAPRAARPGSRFVAALVAYVEAAREAALGQLEALGDTTDRRVLDVAASRWRTGAPVTVRVSAAGLEVMPCEVRFAWNGRENTAAFTVSVGAALEPGPVALCFEVLVADVPMGFIPLRVDITAAASPPTGESVRTAVPRSAFASYASADASTVTARLSTLSHWAPGVDIFMDCLDLRPGEDFKPQLARQIAEREVFMLFWSRRAAASPWVQWEYRTALGCKGTLGILAMPLEHPALAPPPAELAAQHLGDRFLVAGMGLAHIGALAQAPAAPPEER